MVVWSPHRDQIEFVQGATEGGSSSFGDTECFSKNHVNAAMPRRLLKTGRLMVAAFGALVKAQGPSASPVRGEASGRRIVEASC